MKDNDLSTSLYEGIDPYNSAIIEKLLLSIIATKESAREYALCLLRDVQRASEKAAEQMARDCS